LPQLARAGFGLELLRNEIDFLGNICIRIMSSIGGHTLGY